MPLVITDPKAPVKPLTEVERAFAEWKLAAMRRNPPIAQTRVFMDDARQQLSGVPSHENHGYRHLQSRKPHATFNEEFMRDLFRRVTAQPTHWRYRNGLKRKGVF